MLHSLARSASFFLPHQHRGCPRRILSGNGIFAVLSHEGLSRAARGNRRPSITRNLASSIVRACRVMLMPGTLPAMKAHLGPSNGAFWRHRMVMLDINLTCEAEIIVIWRGE